MVQRYRWRKLFKQFKSEEILRKIILLFCRMQLVSAEHLPIMCPHWEQGYDTKL